jgi:hypothetical protein
LRQSRHRRGSNKRAYGGKTKCQFRHGRPPFSKARPTKTKLPPSFGCSSASALELLSRFVDGRTSRIEALRGTPQA